MRDLVNSSIIDIFDPLCSAHDLVVKRVFAGTRGTVAVLIPSDKLCFELCGRFSFQTSEVRARNFQTIYRISATIIDTMQDMERHIIGGSQSTLYVVPAIAPFKLKRSLESMFRKNNVVFRFTKTF